MPEGQSGETRARLEALRDEHCWITSVDVCCHCGDSECDGIGCIARLDTDDDSDHEDIENLHSFLRQGQAWRVMLRLIDEGLAPHASWHIEQYDGREHVAEDHRTWHPDREDW